MRAFPSIDHHGVVSRRELLSAGWGRREIQHALQTRRLLTKYRGVYAIGRADLSVWGERRAAVLACGAGAVLSHRSAAAAWGLRPHAGPSWDVNVPGDRSPKGAGEHPPSPAGGPRADHPAWHPDHDARAHALRSRRRREGP